MKIKEIPDLDGDVWTVYSVCSDNGTSTIESLIDEYGERREKDVARLIYQLDRVSSLGPGKLNSDDVHDFGDGLWQVRAHDLRVMWFYDKGSVVICTHGFLKLFGKTKKSDIKKAKKLKDEYFEAKKNGKIEILEETEEE